jgi:hypothetical protein
VAGFDAQRETAAQAIFGLGESYRQQKRFTEARVQYARILREFVDFPDLVRLSQKQLASTSTLAGEHDERTTVLHESSFGAASATTSNAWREERDLVQQELALVQEELAATKKRIEMGMEQSSTSLPLQREILRLKQQLLRFPRENGAPASSDPGGSGHANNLAPTIRRAGQPSPESSGNYHR